MRLFEKQTFERFRDDDSAAVFSDLEFRNCTFQSCSISNTRSPQLRTTLRNLRLTNCTQYGCYLHAAIVEDVVVDRAHSHGFQTWGAVFKHVTLQGTIDYLMTSRLAVAGLATPQEQRAFDQANAEYYRHVDWALDISRGEFADLELRGVPGRLIRRDPETQALITRQAILDSRWRKLEFHSDVTSVAIDVFLKRGEGDYVLVAPKRAKRFDAQLADIELLRRAGIAEPD
ncbi:MAG: hypothetical protein HY288_18480 [Planctomycetia bacterium]|nr:hypothetical protein [Planctomycetia bacterium]